MSDPHAKFRKMISKAQAFVVIIRCIHDRGETQSIALDELARRGLWLGEAQAKAAGVSRKRAGLGPKRPAWKSRLPVREDVTEVTYHRPPTPWELRFGEGATHYATFNVQDASHGVDGESRILKRWFKSPYDGLRYYR